MAKHDSVEINRTCESKQGCWRGWEPVHDDHTKSLNLAPPKKADLALSFWVSDPDPKEPL